MRSRCFRWDATAARFSSASTASLRRSGFREYYDPLRGMPMGARCFGMSTLAVDMAAAHPGLAD